MTASGTDLAAATIRDLVRSCWVIERSRAAVYRLWARHDGSFEASAGRADERADLIEQTLDEMGYRPDPDVVPAHTSWITGLIGERPDEVSLGPIFLVRLGDWVDGHGAGFFGPRAERIAALASEERESLALPTELPPAPGFNPLEPIAVEAPGEVVLRFGILSDMHIGSPTGEEMVRAAIEDLNRSGAEFVVQLGDITDHGEKAEFEAAARVLGNLEMPFATIMGNHDVLALSEGRLSGREYFADTFGRAPDGVLIERKGIHLALLDSVEHAASPFPPYNLATGAFVEGSGGAIVSGALSHPQHEILAEVAGPSGGPAFVFLHHPPQPFTGFPPVLFGLKEEDSGRLHAVADSGNVWGVFAGHTHRNRLTRRYDKVPVMEVGIPRDFPFGYGLVDVTARGYAYRFLQISNEELLRSVYEHATTIHRRYGTGEPHERGFVWER